MSGHNKWSTIKHKKGAKDAQRGKIFTQLARGLTMAAKSGGSDPSMNSTLALALEKAKKGNLPAANIERAIKNGTGENKDAADIVEVMYEGRGPSGVSFIIRGVTDNKNRTAASIRSIFTKSGASFGESVGYMFEQQGAINTSHPSLSGDDLEMALIEAGAEDIEPNTSGVSSIYMAFTDLTKVAKALESAGFDNQEVKMTYKPTQEVNIDDVDKTKQVLSFLEKLDDNEDVDEVFTNMNISDDIIDEVISDI